MTDIKNLSVGLIMPIAAIDGCTAEHWDEVQTIFTESLISIPGYTFDTNLVSASDSIGLIHKRIVQGVYNSDIVICDVSCKNPNVMFELGMRLAFDKPTIIVKDDVTSYSFDTGGIEHIEYPRDLRFSKIIEFKRLLGRKTIATYEDSIKDPDHSPFLKSFGQFSVSKLKEIEGTQTDIILNKLSELQTDILSLNKQQKPILMGKQHRDLTKLIKDSVIENRERFGPEILRNIEELFDLVLDELAFLGISPKILENKSFQNFMRDTILETIEKIQS